MLSGDVRRGGAPGRRTHTGLVSPSEGGAGRAIIMARARGVIAAIGGESRGGDVVRAATVSAVLPHRDLNSRKGRGCGAAGTARALMARAASGLPIRGRTQGLDGAVARGSPRHGGPDARDRSPDDGGDDDHFPRMMEHAGGALATLARQVLDGDTLRHDMGYTCLH